MYDEKNIESEFLKRPKSNPFKTPDQYFDSIEDRILERIEHGTPAPKKISSTKVLQLLKPVLGLVASFSLIYLLVYYPINHFLPKTITTDTTAPTLADEYTFLFSSFDENTVVDAILSDQKTYVSEINPDEVLAYLSSGLNDLEIYSEIQN